MSDDKNKKKDKYGKIVNIQKYDVKAFDKEKLPYAMICIDVVNQCTNYLAGWIWIYLQSKPPTWNPCKWEIMKRFDISERTYQRQMSYLSATNLVETYSERNNDGTIGVWRIKVLNGTRFNPDGDKPKVKLHEIKKNHTAKFGVVEEPAPDKGFAHTANFGEVGTIQTAKKPQCGEMAGYIYNRLTTTNDLPHTQESEFFLEKTLFLDSEQQRKAIVLRERCLQDQKAINKHARLNGDKTFTEVLDECVTHYATQQSPQLVSPQRLQSWIQREMRFQIQQSAKPASKYPTKEERDAEYKNIAARERAAEANKRAEIQQSARIKDLLKKAPAHINFKEMRAQQEDERIKLGMTAGEHLEYLIRKKKNELEHTCT